MKHAFLIIAHNEFPVLKILLSLLDDPRNDIFVHIDKKSNDLFEKVSNITLEHAGLYVLSNRIKVFWGDISQVKVEFLLFEAALNHGPYAYYHLLSGVDLPIKNQDYIHDFFYKNKGMEFVDFWEDDSHKKDLMRKVLRYYLFTQKMKDRTNIIHHLTSFIRNIFLIIQKIFFLKRKNDLVFKKGSNWISITHEFCKYVVSNKELILRRMKYTLCSDEIFIQTLLWNSKFRENIFNFNDFATDSIREIDWSKGNPYVWKDNDFDYLINSKKIFARKFSFTDKSIIFKIEKFLTQ